MNRDYLRAVVDALEAAGLPVADWRVEEGPPIEGWIAFDLRRPSIVTWEHDQTGLGWSAHDGWYLLLINSPGRRTTIPLPLTPSAPPAEVVEAVRPDTSGWS
jgi:hypothetical protein